MLHNIKKAVYLCSMQKANNDHRDIVQMLTECQGVFVSAHLKTHGAYHINAHYVIKCLSFMEMLKISLPIWRFDKKGILILGFKKSPYSCSVYIHTNIGIIRVSDHHCDNKGSDEILNIVTTGRKIAWAKELKKIKSV